MTSGNLDRFHRIQREWRERHRLGPDLLAEDVEWVNPPNSVEPGTRTGLDSFNAAIDSIFEGWEQSRFEFDRVLDAGDDVVALGHLALRGRSVAVDVTQEHGQVWSFRDGRAIRLRWFNSQAEALAAAGVDE